MRDKPDAVAEATKLRRPIKSIVTDSRIEKKWNTSDMEFVVTNVSISWRVL